MMSLGAYWKDLRAKMVADPLSPDRVASGWALGMFIGCSVPFGMQLVVSIPLAIAFRVSKIGATVGTLITNPVSIFFIYPAQTWVGSRLLGMPLSWTYVRDIGSRLRNVSLFSGEGWAVLSDIGARVLGGFFLGGLLLAVIMTPLTFFIVRGIVNRARLRRQAASEPT